MKIYTLIVTYNGLHKDWIGNCINSLLKSSLTSEIIVVDNNSQDDTVTFIKKNFPKVVLIENKDNAGFGKANNQGMEYALHENADYVFLLNQDAFVQEDTLQKLVNAHNLNNSYGVLSPIHFNYDGTELEYYFSVFMGLDRTPSFYCDHIVGKPRILYKTKFVNAAAWLVPAQVLREVGGFDSVFYHYGEDDNFCQRVRYHEYEIGVVAGAYIYHDSNIRVHEEIPVGSEKYFFEYENYLKIRYGDINTERGKSYQYERNTILVNILKGLVSLDINEMSANFSKLGLLKRTFALLSDSREKNKMKGHHYLNL